MKLILVCILFITFTLAHKVPMRRVESLRKKLIREGRLQEYLKERQLKRTLLGGQSTAPGELQFDFEDVEYAAEIEIGTPPQKFWIQIDTGSSDLWITGSDCTTCGTGDDCKDDCEVKCDSQCCSRGRPALFSKTFSKSAKEDSPCDDKNQYDGSKSSTYQNLNQPFSIQYGTGSCSGTYVKDTVCLAGICVPQQEMADANFLAKDFTDDNVDGICGMAFAAESANRRTTPVFQNMINQGLVTNPWFTMFLEAEGDKNNASGGYMTLGDYDTEHCASKCDWVPLSSATYYEFILQGVSVGKGANEKIIFKNTGSNADMTAISDTGTSFIVGPYAQIQSINQQLGGKLNLDYGGWVVDCDNMNLPPVVFQINGKDYPVEAKNYIVYADKKTCILGFGVGGGNPQWILGDTFIRQFCNVYDMGNKRLGLCDTL